MNTAGLQAILEKEEIVQTQGAEELRSRPKIVDQTYTQYVRSYIPLGQQGKEGRSVIGFERQLIREIKNKRVPRGYITADYGYGKTSTALYLWQQARAENLLAIPPFRLVYLHDLITATSSWLQYELQRTRPSSPLIEQTQALYETVMRRNVQSIAEHYNMSLADAGRLWKDKPQVRDLTEGDYLDFLTKATHIALEAGFEGLFILADEVQQYIDPEVKAGIRDPLSALFNIISGLITRQNYEPMGILFVIPPRELETLRGQRGDFNQRVQPGLDLRTIYDREFPQRLWYRLAEQFDFKEHAPEMVTEETLRALGQISMRNDLSDGPRTVVNSFKRITKRYIDLNYAPGQAYQPIDLIEDFLAQQITFDSSQKIRRLTHQALDHHLVRGYADREQAVKWAAAFPEEGLRRSWQGTLGLEQAVDDLMKSANRDIFIGVGSYQDYAVTLRDYRQDEKTDVISLLIDEFWRQYQETVFQTRLRAMQAFFALLRMKAFPEAQWKVLEEQTDDLMTRNQGMKLEGHFTRYSRIYPKRLIQVRILWEDEAGKDMGMGVEGELTIQIRLRRHLDKSEAERRDLHESLEIDHAARQINLTFNLMCLDEGNISASLNEAMRDIIEPYKMTPLLMLNLYEFINEKRRNNQLDQQADTVIQTIFQPELLDNVYRLLFNAMVGQPVGAAEERILELVTEALLQTMYPDYSTLMKADRWQSSLTKYRNALKRLEFPQERQGQIRKEGTKQDIADLFALTNPALETFMRNFPELLSIKQELTTNKRESEAGKKGAVLFTLHPLERDIKAWLKDSPVMETIKGQPIHALPKTKLYTLASQQGYRNKEIDEIIALMTERDLIEENKQGYIQEQFNVAFSVDELVDQIMAWQDDLNILLQGYNSEHLKAWGVEADKALHFASETLRTGKYQAGQDIGAQRRIRERRQELKRDVEERRERLGRDLTELQRNIPQPNPQQGKTLEQTVNGGVSYVEQVNDIRNRLHKQFTEFSSKTGAHQQEVTDLIQSVKTDDVSLSRLVQVQQAYQALQRQGQPLQAQAKTFAQKFNDFLFWQNLVSSGSELANETQQLGDLVQSQQGQLQNLFKEINGHLSAYKEDALPDAHQFEVRLEEVKQSVRKIKNKATHEFNSLQERYRTMLIEKGDFTQDKLWPNQSYNPTAPGHSYQHLYHEVQRALRQLHQQLEKKLNDLQADTQSTLQTPRLKELSPDNRISVEENGKDLLNKFEQSLQSLKTIDNHEILRDFPQFDALLNQYAEILNIIKSTVGQVNKIQQIISEGTPTSEDEPFINILKEQEGQTELSLLRKHHAVSDEEFWSTLRRLYEKRDIRLFCEMIRRA